MTIQPYLPIVALTLALAACPQTPEPPKPRAATAPAAIETAQAAAPAAAGVASPKGPAASAHADGIDWRKGDVDAAFVAARADQKPLFLYWGAVWCPPCNQVKATLFNRQDFIERSRFFVPVYIDGDSPSAQKLGAGSARWPRPQRRRTRGPRPTRRRPRGFLRCSPIPGSCARTSIR